MIRFGQSQKPQPSLGRGGAPPFPKLRQGGMQISPTCENKAGSIPPPGLHEH